MTLKTTLRGGLVRPRRRYQVGSVRSVLVWLSVAAALFATVALAVYASGERDLGYIAFFSILIVLAIAFLSPRRFQSLRGASPDWEDDGGYELRPGYRPEAPTSSSSDVPPDQKGNVQ